MEATQAVASSRLETLAGLEGLISEAVGVRLMELAATVPSGQAIVEVGCYKGKSTSYLAAGAMEGLGARVYAVDPWTLPGNANGRFGFNEPNTHRAFIRQVMEAGVDSQITVIRGYSVAAAKAWKYGPIGLLYIDGSHLEKDVRADWLAWSRYLAPGATVAFDDYDTPRNPGVKAAVDRIEGRRWEYEPVPLAIGYAR